MFGRTPKTPFEIRQTEAFRAASASAQYAAGSPDGKRAGIFYVPILDATQYNVTSLPPMEDVFLHEAIPGHHYQISLQQENTGLPKFRRFGGYGAFSEGWALYCESLGKELGLYTDPYQYVGVAGRRDAPRHPAGGGCGPARQGHDPRGSHQVHDGQRSHQRAAGHGRNRALHGQPRPGAELQNRPAQNPRAARPLRKAAGQKFDLRAFHDELLAGGSMPLAVLERNMDAWAARQR